MKSLQKIAKKLEGQLGKIDPVEAVEGKEVAKEFEIVKNETKKNESKGISKEVIGIQTPGDTNVDETRIFDQDLINNLKNRFREWKIGYKEQNAVTGDEFEPEMFLEGYEKPFLIDVKKSIKSKIQMFRN